MVRWLSPERGDTVWEIGPGLGAMTEALLREGAVCTVFEIDRGLCGYLEDVYGARDDFTLVCGDFVKTWREALLDHGLPQLLLGNLPYRSASLMIVDIIIGGLRPRRAVMTVQREAADRMCSAPGLKSYSSFSVLCQATFSLRILGELKPGSFYPAPDVSSAIMELVPRKDAPSGSSLRILEVLARALFASRRKTIRNNLTAALLPERVSRDNVLEALLQMHVDPAGRAEVLAPEIFVAVAKALAPRSDQEIR
jgi:16S rRNA (adenine1518-N6/adenine1519-N6)-dimethyltransferase